jgi:chemotaxis protein histidine kinase CheA
LELLNEFCNEGRDLLIQVEQGVLVLEDKPRHKDTLNQVFRAFHTFKGGAGFLGIAPIQLLAHHLESLLDAARKDQLPIDQTVIDVILAGGDALQKYVSAIARQLAGEDRGQAIFVATAELLQRIQTADAANRQRDAIIIEGRAAAKSADDFTAEARLDGGSPFPVFFDDSFVDSLGVASSSPSATCLSTDVATATLTSTMLINSVTYRVAAIEPDGSGVTVLRLHRT